MVRTHLLRPRPPSLHARTRTRAGKGICGNEKERRPLHHPLHQFLVLSPQSLMQQRPHGLEQEEFGACRLGIANSLPSTYHGSVNMASMTSTGPEHGTAWVLRSRVQPSMNQFREGTFLDVPSSTMQGISSPVRIASAGTHNNQSAFGDQGHSLGKMNGHYGFQGSGAFNPHSLPDFHNSGIPYNLRTIPPIGVNSNSRTAEGMDSRHLYEAGCAKLCGHSSGHTEALGFSRTGMIRNHCCCMLKSWGQLKVVFKSIWICGLAISAWHDKDMCTKLY